MKATIHTIGTNGYEIDWETGEAKFEELLELVPKIEKHLERAGYHTTGAVIETPEGLPICPKHREIMHRREKQGDLWYSHNAGSEQQPVYCKGRPGKDSPGWNVETR